MGRWRAKKRNEPCSLLLIGVESAAIIKAERAVPLCAGQWSGQPKNIVIEITASCHGVRGLLFLYLEIQRNSRKVKFFLPERYN